MKTYQVGIKRWRGRTRLRDATSVVLAEDETEARKKALRDAYWQDQRKGTHCQYEVIDVREVEEHERPDYEQRLVARAIEVVGSQPEAWHNRCHEVSITLVRAGLFGSEARVARGWCEGVTSQHSWIAVSGDCYDRSAKIVDPTLHTFRADVTDVLWSGSLLAPGWHHPHGEGKIWDYGRPYHHGKETVELDRVGLSIQARTFLDMIEPLDVQGWVQLAHAPVGGWPASEIVGKMYDDDRLRALVPIEVVGMITDRNPNELYR